MVAATKGGGAGRRRRTSARAGPASGAPDVPAFGRPFGTVAATDASASRSQRRRLPGMPANERARPVRRHVSPCGCCLEWASMAGTMTTIACYVRGTLIRQSGFSGVARRIPESVLLASSDLPFLSTRNCTPWIGETRADPHSFGEVNGDEEPGEADATSRLPCSLPRRRQTAAESRRRTTRMSAKAAGQSHSRQPPSVTMAATRSEAARPGCRRPESLMAKPALRTRRAPARSVIRDGGCVGRSLRPEGSDLGQKARIRSKNIQIPTQEARRNTHRPRIVG